ncbi:MAG: hypothetical protein AUI14_10160 [Actinobacteria bacterium 13_2_20CM_2_71_6]|nr:MAG: hypothetical protein AUI14_10160 [Actinobacteria bacterium 13_2_20CM_2_71_6]
MRFFAGAILAAHFAPIDVTRVLVGGLAWWCATVVVYVVNGISDVTEDRLNNSQRPVARGELSIPDAIHACWGLALAAVILAAFVGRGMLPLLLVFLALGYLYSAPPFALKRRTMGASFVAALGGLVTYAAGYTVTGGTAGAPLLLFALAMSGWMGLVGIQAKDLSDAVGDAAAGRQTIAVRWTEAQVRATLATTALAVGGGFLYLADHLAPAMHAESIAVFVGALALAAVVLSRISTGNRTRRRTPYRVFMATQYAAHLALVGTVFAV